MRVCILTVEVQVLSFFVAFIEVGATFLMSQNMTKAFTKGRWNDRLCISVMKSLLNVMLVYHNVDNRVGFIHDIDLLLNNGN